MGSKTAYLEAALLAQSFGQTPWTPPGTWYALLSTDAFDPTVTSATEPAGGNYNRYAVTNDASQWAAPAGSNPATVANLAEWDFPAASADWGTIRSVYLADAASGGNLCYGTAVSGDGVPVSAGSAFTVPAGGFLIREF